MHTKSHPYNDHYLPSQATKCSQPASYTGPINYSTPLTETCTLIFISKKQQLTFKQKLLRALGF